MPFQKCPVCNGSGVGHLPLFPTTKSTRPPCKICAGAGIIDELTGAPPQYKRQVVSAVSRDYEKQFHDSLWDRDPQFDK